MFYYNYTSIKEYYVIYTGCFPQGCAAFKLISPNVEKEESGIKDDSGMQDVQYTEVHTMTISIQGGRTCLFF